MKVLVLNGSPAGEDSITLYTVKYIEKHFPGCAFEVIHVARKIKAIEKDFSACAASLRGADLILFCYPVYTFLVPAQLHRFVELMKNARVRDYFLTRMGELLATTLSTESVTQRIMERSRALLPEMERNCARWGWSLSTWKRFGTKMVRFAEERPLKLIGYFQKSMGLSDQEMQKYFGAAVAKACG